MGFFYVAIGGSLGAVCRYSVGLLIQSSAVPSAFHGPAATVAVNLAGSFLIGLSYPLIGTFFEAHHKLLLITGFLGSFTTFSTFALDTVSFTETMHSIAYLLISLAGGVLLVIAGIWISRTFISN